MVRVRGCYDERMCDDTRVCYERMCDKWVCYERMCDDTRVCYERMCDKCV